MKKILVFFALLGVLGVGAVSAEPVDMVVLLDTSESMFPYFNEVTHYLIGDILTQQLRKGDTFSLLSFASRPEIEVSRQIESKQDIQDVINRVLLLQPLGRYTDFVLAVKYLYQFTVDLPLSTKKDILILTDGIHDPPPGSSFPNKLGPNGQDLSGNRQEIVDIANEIRQRGWEVHILQFPSGGIPSAAAVGQPGVELLPYGSAKAGSAAPGQAGAPGAGVAPGAAASGGSGAASSGASGAAAGAGRPQVGPAARASSAGGAAQGAKTGASPGGQPNDSLFRTLAEKLGVHIEEYQGTTKTSIAHVATGAPELTFPGYLGKVGYDLTVPFTIRNFEGSPILVQLNRVLYNGANLLQSRVSLPLQASKSGVLKAHLRLPVTLRPGKQSISVDLEFADSARVFPHTGLLSFTLRGGIAGSGGVSLVLLPILFAIVLIAAGILVFFLVRRIVESLAAAAPATVHPRVHYDAGRRLVKPVEMRVAGQNPNIGGRNVHPFGSGGRKSIGGGSSSFLIYLYTLPAHIAEIGLSGDRFVFTPLHREFFPGLSGPLEDCLGKEIRLRTKEGRELTVVFREYVSPLDQVNRVMHLIDHPGAAGSARESAGGADTPRQ